MDILLEIKELIIDGKHKEIDDVVKSAIEKGVDLQTIINDAMISAMDVVGERYANNEIYVPEMLVSAITMKRGLDIINPIILEAGEKKSRGKITMCTVKGDIHDIGKNLVIMMLQGAGFDVADLGVDISIDNFIERVATLKPDIVGLTALLTTSVPVMEKFIVALSEKGLRDNVKVMVGGAPLNPTLAKQIGADGYAPDAGKAVVLARRLMGEDMGENAYGTIFAN